MEFTDKIALVTGGTSGMGLAAARRLLDGGATVVITGRDDARLAAAALELGDPQRLLTVRADVSVAADADRTTAAIAERFGHLDIVFANAGIALFKPFDVLGDAEADRLLDINVKGVLLTLRRSLPLLADGGAIVLNASWTAHRGLAGGSVYAASKAAVASLARSLAAELAPRGIRVNAVSPGYIRTDMFVTAVPDNVAEGAVRKQIALGRIGTAEEVADAVAFLASEQARYVTGQELIIDGGLLGAVAA
ncbi:SDR family NAD(P)-dependent oxidoreductase [Conexibacter woesei]|uniref:Short-chain dehydrogenase/reductase SDR n=1 Tax=Conexibacter woesei (strain DSM 14684 / CCUG 47730 / CIP 108061 / JCM 11494 / NBRC 100937 / ID131577) TaxID=469383 RepID=D3EYW2_CONWI|nr:glucose 1-dehydrogenase [Conexibacter woesei]ADB49836.1 short-chain dehydrogenase/reductase SDR [Conexibacter woesei DSM 14684]